jgi:hypothetical protein
VRVALTGTAADWASRLIVGLAAMALLLPVLSACGTQAEVIATLERFDVRQFGPDSANLTNEWWMPDQPGTKRTYWGTVRDIPQTVETLMTSETKVIAGVTVRVIRDRDVDAGQLVEETEDYYAQDLKGNVWYLGEVTTHYVNGVLTDHADTWVVGVKGANAGIIMWANPRLGQPKYRQEFAKNLAEDMGRVLSFNQSVCVPFRCFNDAMLIEETTPLDPGVIEHKYYARGVGLIRAVHVQGDPEESNLAAISRPAP